MGRRGRGGGGGGRGSAFRARRRLGVSYRRGALTPGSVEGLRVFSAEALKGRRHHAELSAPVSVSVYLPLLRTLSQLFGLQHTLLSFLQQTTTSNTASSGICETGGGGGGKEKKIFEFPDNFPRGREGGGTLTSVDLKHSKNK